MKIFYEDEYIIVCEKMPGVPSQSDKTRDMDMVSRLKNYLFEKEPKGGKPYIGLVHRLDRPVGGIMVFAKSSYAAAQLSQQIQKREMVKKYLAVLSGEYSLELSQEKKLLIDYLRKDGRTNLSVVTHEKDKEGKRAELFYKIQDVKDGLSLAEIQLLTGRHHQIRVQMATHKNGIWGDTKYNKEFQSYKGWVAIGLYAYYLEFGHPKNKKKMIFEHKPQSEPFQLFFE